MRLIKLMSWTRVTRLIRWKERNIARDVISEGIIQAPKDGSLLIAYSYVTPRNVHMWARYFIAE